MVAVLLTVSACRATAWIQRKRQIFEKVGRELEQRFEGGAVVGGGSAEREAAPLYAEERQDLHPAEREKGAERGGVKDFSEVNTFTLRPIFHCALLRNILQYFNDLSLYLSLDLVEEGEGWPQLRQVGYNLRL